MILYVKILIIGLDLKYSFGGKLIFPNPIDLLTKTGNLTIAHKLI